MTTIETQPDQELGGQIQQLAGRLLGSVVAVLELATIHLGSELGLYRSLSVEGCATSVELASQTQTDERYVREWLEQQAVAGLLDCDNASAPPSQRRYALPAATAEVLVNRDSPAYLGAIGQMAMAFGGVAPALLDAFRTGAGIPWSAYGDGARRLQAELNRPAYLTQLAQEWLPALPDVDARLGSRGGRIADIGCGAGWSSIAFALAYPKAEIDGIDLDDASVADARRNAAESGVADRIRFEVRDAAAPGLPAGAYDLVAAFETIHDMADPVAALAAMRALVSPEGAVLIADNAVDEEFEAPGNEPARLAYGSSVLLCLPAGRNADTSAATGAAMRPSTFEGYARRAGFSRVDQLAVPHPFLRFWRLSS